MESLSSVFSASGRIARKPFAIGIVVVYGLMFLAQLLLSQPVTARLGIAPFAILQLALTWAWLALHVRRRRDASRSIDPAVGIAILYGLAIVLWSRSWWA